MIEIKEAIEIARILAKAPQERLPMIISVFESADLTVEGLEELEAWAIGKNSSYVIELDDFMIDVEKEFNLKKNSYLVAAIEFTRFCKEKKLDVRNTRRWLARKGVIKSEEIKGKTNYTFARRVNGKTIRCVVFNEDWKEGNKGAAKD